MGASDRESVSKKPVAYLAGTTLWKKQLVWSLVLCFLCCAYHEGLALERSSCSKLKPSRFFEIHKLLSLTRGPLRAD